MSDVQVEFEGMDLALADLLVLRKKGRRGLAMAQEVMLQHRQHVKDAVEYLERVESALDRVEPGKGGSDAE